MHICLITLDYAPYRSSGLAVYGEQIAEALLAANHRVTVLAALRPGTDAESGAGTLRILRVPIDRSDWIGYSWRAARRVAELHSQEPFDRVHFLDVHFAYAYNGAYSASLLQSFRQRLGAAYASSWRNLAQRSAYYWLAQGMEARAARRAHALLAMSASTRDEFAALYRLPANSIAVIAQGIDTGHFRRHEAAMLRAELGLGDAPVLVYIGFSTPRKGLEYLVEALNELPGARLVIVGRWEAGYREKVRRRAGAAWQRVVEVGYVADEQIPRYLSLADVFVLPSLLEGFGIPLIEAMACGTPVVATSAGSIPEVVGDAGLLVPPRDPEALANALRRLLEDPALRRTLAQRGLERVRALFDLQTTRGKLVQWFQANPAAPPPEYPADASNQVQ